MNDSFWQPLSARLRNELGVDWDLFTVLEVDRKSGLVRRSYSSDERNYPSGGVKALMQSEWAEHVIFKQRVFSARNEASFRWAFSDYALLESLDLRFALNVPVVEQGETVRTLNFLRGSPAFLDREQAVVEAAVADHSAQK